jgi:hypothetical protein
MSTAAIFCIVRAAIIVKRWFGSICRRTPDTPIEKVDEEDYTYAESWKSEKGFMFQTVWQDEDKKVRVFYPYEEIRRRRPTDELSRFFVDCKPPWFFIGCDNSVDHTMDLEPYVCAGNVIRPELLQHLFPGSKRWIYVHPTTFEETEFPSAGISIENDGK